MVKKMSVTIYTESGSSIGLGHVFRCFSLIQAFSVFKITPSFIVRGDLDVKKILNYQKYRFYDWISDRDRLITELPVSDIVVVDSYNATLRILRRIASNARLSVFIDDYARLEYPQGIVINSSINTDKFASKQNNKFLLGGDYALLRKEFWHRPRFIVRKKIANLLISMGGTDYFHLSEKVLDIILKKYSAIKIDLVIGPGFPRNDFLLHKTHKQPLNGFQPI